MDQEYLKSIGLSDDHISEFQQKLTDYANEQRSGVDGKNRELLTKMADAKRQLEQFEGIDPDRYKELSEKFDKMEHDKLIDKGEFEKLKTQLVQNHQSELQKIQEERDGAKKTLESYVIDSEVIKAISAEKGKPNLLTLVVKSQTQLSEDGKVVVLDSNGQVRLNSDGSNMTVLQLVQELKKSEDYMPAFDPSGLSGADARQSRVTRSGVDSSNMSPREKMSSARPVN